MPSCTRVTAMSTKVSFTGVIRSPSSFTDCITNNCTITVDKQLLREFVATCIHPAGEITCNGISARH